jgi:hypothetical protein
LNPIQILSIFNSIGFGLLAIRIDPCNTTVPPNVKNAKKED